MGNYTKTDGSQAAMADVWFAKQEVEPPTAAELLSGPAADVLLGSGSDAPVAAPAATASAGGAGGLMSRAMVDDDLLRNSVALI